MKMSLPTFDLCQVRFKSFSSNETETGKYISLKRGTSISFSGSGISLIWSSGFGILKQTSGEIRDWKYVQEVGYQNNPRDYGIARNFGSGLRDWIRRTLLGILRGYRMYGRRTLQRYGRISTNLALLMERQLTDSGSWQTVEKYGTDRLLLHCLGRIALTMMIL